MTPEEFIDDLSVHFGKRHANERAERVWIRDMLAVIGRTDHAVLDRAYEITRDEHDERAFPLPAVLRRYIARAAAELSPPPEHRILSRESSVSSSAEELAQRKALVAELLAELKTNMAAQFIPKDTGELADVSRPAFEAKQRRTRNPVHFTQHGLTELSKRMTGEQE